MVAVCAICQDKPHRSFLCWVTSRDVDRLWCPYKNLVLNQRLIKIEPTQAKECRLWMGFVADFTIEVPRVS